MLPQVEPSSSRIQTISLLVLAVVAGMYSIYWLRPVLVPLVVALFVVSAVSSILKTLETRLGIHRTTAAGLTILTGLGLLFAFGVSVWMSMIELNKNSGIYRGRVQEIVQWAEQQAQQFGERFGRQAIWGLPAEGEAGQAVADPIAMPSTAASEAASPATVKAPAVGFGRGDAGELVDRFVRDGIAVISQALFSMVSTSVLVLIYVYFLLIGRPVLQSKSPTMNEIDHHVRSYLGLKTVISIFTGLAFGLALRLFGVPMALTFGVLAFLLNFVPNIGPMVASLLPIPLIVLHPDATWMWMVSAITVTCGIQAISGNIVEPKIMGDSSDLHPVTILVALMFWGMMWGVIGMFLATPITAALKILLQRIDATRPLADLMAGRLSGPAPADDLPATE